MKLETAPYVPAPKRASAFLEGLQMLTGVALILFLWSHLFFVATVNIGPEVLNGLARFFEDIYIAQIGGPAIGLIFFLHFILAARKIPFRYEQQQILWQHSRRLHHTDTWLWVIQASTAMIILILGAIHLWTTLTDLPITAVKGAQRIQGGYWLVFFLILLPVVGIHMGIGLYRIAVKWGLLKRTYRIPFKKFGNILVLFYILIGLMSIIRFLTLPV
ncbi:MAG: hypothetical protein Q8P24_14885 [Desulfobacterales bacterium]|nr:hypothetical protein [Desulfobacterales bacterium]